MNFSSVTKLLLREALFLATDKPNDNSSTVNDNCTEKKIVYESRQNVGLSLPKVKQNKFL